MSHTLRDDSNDTQMCSNAALERASIQERLLL